MNNKSKWDSLTLKEKSEIMKIAISSGVMDLNNIRSSYNSFAEGGPTEESKEEYIPATAAGFIAKQFGASPETQAEWDLGSATFNIASDSIPVVGNAAGMLVSIGDAIYDIGKFIVDPNWGNASDVGTSLLSIIPGLDIKEVKSLYKAGKQTVKNTTKVGVKEAAKNTVKTRKHGQKKSYIYELYPNKAVRGDRVYMPSSLKTFGTLGNISDTTEDYLIGIEGLMNR